MSMRANLLLVVVLGGCQTGASEPEQEPRGLVLQKATRTQIVALYETDAVDLRLEATAADGRIATRISWSDGRVLTTLDVPDSADVVGPMIAAPVREAAIAARAALDRDGGVAAAAYGPMLSELYEATTDLGDAPIRTVLAYHEGIIAAHQWSRTETLRDDDECDIHDGDVTWHARWMHQRVGELEAFRLDDLRAEDSEDPYGLCIAFLSECCYTIGCYLHDVACMNCGSELLCGGECEPGDACLGRCGGGCGSCGSSSSAQ
jgi:hypothetical protein